MNYPRKWLIPLYTKSALIKLINFYIYTVQRLIKQIKRFYLWERFSWFWMFLSFPLWMFSLKVPTQMLQKKGIFFLVLNFWKLFNQCLWFVRCFLLYYNVKKQETVYFHSKLNLFLLQKFWLDMLINVCISIDVLIKEFVSPLN